MSRKAATYTVEAIAKSKGISDTGVRRALKGVTPADHVDGYNGRKVAAYSKEQVAAAFPVKKGRKAEGKA